MRTNAAKPSERSRVDRLVVSNVLEWGIQPERRELPECAPPPARERFGPEDMALCWSGDRKVVVTRHPLDDGHVADVSRILGYQEVHCVALPPGRAGNSLSADLAGDERTLGQVLDLIQDGPADGPVVIEGCASTPEYAQLIDRIRDRSRRPVTDWMTPAQHLDLNGRLDSKLHAREYFEAALPGCAAMRLTRAVALRTGPDLVTEVQQAVPRLAPAILKTEFGAGGHAMAIIRSSDEAGRAIAGALPAGYQGHLLIEEFLGHGSDLLSVSYNGLVQEDGKVFSLAAGAHFLSAGKFYLGSHLGVGSMPADCAAKVRTASEAIGAAAGAAGYRGPLNIDFLYRRSDGVIFPLEINPRRTLGATLAEVCISLFGLGYEKIVSAVALHTVPVHRTIRTYPELRDALLRKGWLGRETPGLIVLPYMVTSLATQSVIGLAVLGVDGTPAGEALSEITSYLARRRWR